MATLNLEPAISTRYRIERVMYRGRCGIETGSHTALQPIPRARLKVPGRWPIALAPGAPRRGGRGGEGADEGGRGEGVHWGRRGGEWREGARGDNILVAPFGSQNRTRAARRKGSGCIAAARAAIAPCHMVGSSSHPTNQQRAALALSKPEPLARN